MLRKFLQVLLVTGGWTPDPNDSFSMMPIDNTTLAPSRSFATCLTRRGGRSVVLFQQRSPACSPYQPLHLIIWLTIAILSGKSFEENKTAQIYGRKPKNLKKRNLCLLQEIVVGPLNNTTTMRQRLLTSSSFLSWSKVSNVHTCALKEVLVCDYLLVGGWAGQKMRKEEWNQQPLLCHLAGPVMHWVGG